jgi:hypothetical protein
MTRRLHATSAALSGARAKWATVSGTAAAIAMGALCLDPASRARHAERGGPRDRGRVTRSDGASGRDQPDDRTVPRIQVNPLVRSLTQTTLCYKVLRAHKCRHRAYET